VKTKKKKLIAKVYSNRDYIVEKEKAIIYITRKFLILFEY
jgi:hypothetical protein